MKQQVSHRTAFSIVFVVLAASIGHVSAGPAKDRITGDWQVKIDADGRQMVSIISLSADKEGTLSGKWISFWGASDLSDLKYENNELTFSRTSRFRGRETNSTFSGRIKQGKLSGTFSRGLEKSEVECKRIRTVSRAAGSWDMKIKAGEQEYAATLQVSAGKKGRLTADWKSQWGEHEIENIEFKNSNLTFKRNSKVQDRNWESVFEGQIKGHALSGTFKSERGEIAAKGQRIGADLVGKWELQIQSDSGSRTQILRVYPDLSGLYGPIPIAKVYLEGDTVSFKTGLEFGERKLEYSFTGKLYGKKLSGELTGSRGSQKVDGLKISPRSARKGSGKAKTPSRKPDVIFVPTPQKVVERMLQLAEVKKDDLVYDLGCGDGRIVVTAAKKFGCRGVGYDISRKRVRESLENVRKNNVENLVRIEQKDIFTLDLSEVNVITLYLLPELNVRLIPQLEKLKPGARIVSHDFDMKGVRPDKVVEIKDEEDGYGEHTIYLWTTPLKREGVGDE